MNSTATPESNFAESPGTEKRYFLRHAPPAMVTAALPGAVNYAIILLLSFGWGFEETGRYRLLFSYFALLGLISLAETNKTFVRAIVEENKKAIAGLVTQRLGFAAAAFAAIFCGYRAGVFLDIGLVYVAALAMVIHPLDLYLAKLQADQKFDQLLVGELAKYTAALAAFILVISSGHAVEMAVIAQLSVIAVFHIAYWFHHCGRLLRLSDIPKRYRTVWSQRANKQARTYSLAALVPSSLEHIDKILVGWVFGLEILGIYVLAYSTGRFVYNAIKPGFYIYYRRFVSQMPSTVLLCKTGAAFTAIGMVCAALFLIAITTIPPLVKFQDGAVVTVILFLAYGIGMVRAVYGQAYTINKRSNAVHMLRASLITSIACMILLAAALALPSSLALVFLALQYPLRDALTVLLLLHYRGASS